MRGRIECPVLCVSEATRRSETLETQNMETNRRPGAGPVHGSGLRRLLRRSGQLCVRQRVRLGQRPRGERRPGGGPDRPHRPGGPGGGPGGTGPVHCQLLLHLHLCGHRPGGGGPGGGLGEEGGHPPHLPDGRP